VIRFIPLGRSTGVVRVKATLARLDVRPPFLAPVRVLLAYGTSVRLDDIEECRATNSAGLFCSEP
jgi:hypothetical protein